MKAFTRAGLILLVFLLVLPCVVACGEDEETSPTDANAQGLIPSWLNDPDEPPLNPYLADIAWSTTHRNSYCQGSSPFAGPTEVPAGEVEDYLPGRPVCPTVLFSAPYPDGSRVIWGASTRFHVFKADPNGQHLRYISWLPTAELQADPMTDEMVKSLGDMKAPELADLMDKTFPSQESESGSQPGMSGVYYLLDKDNLFYQPRGKTIYVYGDKIPDDRFSPIELKRTYEIPVGKLTRDDDFLYGVVMTYDGMLAFYTVFGTVGIIDRSLNPDTAQFVQLPEGEYIGNQPACDENGGIYIVTQKQVHRVQWTGKELTLDEKKGAWSAPYEGGIPKGRKLQEGSGSSPTLMGTGNQDKFVVITDGAQIMNIVLFWRDDIPDDWKQIPGTESRRIAAQVPVTFGDPNAEFTWSEQSVLVRGYGAFVPNDVLKTYHPNTIVNVIMSGEPDRAPSGCEKFEWDPQMRQLKSVWTNQEVSRPNCIPTMSSATNLIYVIGQRSGVWTLEAIDWSTGESAWHYEIGDKSRHNSAYAAIQIGPDGAIYYPTFWGIMRIRPTIEALPHETMMANEKSQSTTPAAGPTWVYTASYGDEETIWTGQVTGEEAVDGANTRVIKTSYDKTPARKSFSAQVNGLVDLSLVSETVWRDQDTLDPVKKVSLTKAMGVLDITATTTYAYSGDSGAPLSEGKTWTYEAEIVPSMGNPYSQSWKAEVIGMEKVTVPMGTFDCYKVVHTSEGKTRTEWWPSDGDFIAPVKTVDEAAYELAETQELVSYSK